MISRRFSPSPAIAGTSGSEADRCSFPQTSVASRRPYNPRIAPDGPAVTPMGFADTLSRLANRPAERKTVSTVRWPSIRSRVIPIWTRPVMFRTSCMKPAFTKSEAASRHHSPFVVRGPKFPPQAMIVAGSLRAPLPITIPRNTTTLMAMIAGVTIGHGVRSLSALRNVSSWARTAVAVSFATQNLSSSVRRSLRRSSGFMT